MLNRPPLQPVGGRAAARRRRPRPRRRRKAILQEPAEAALLTAENHHLGAPGGQGRAERLKALGGLQRREPPARHPAQGALINPHPPLPPKRPMDRQAPALAAPNKITQKGVGQGVVPLRHIAQDADHGGEND
ncbi:MAG: hypothetical protein M2R45_01128 [Verrucomicrobia subdivision 3 bacterium]|nr:hypothetical protein [Limisphaerales bacterium]MCS1417487.1 hypothetical protein [Limisphaerales bacterium]